jgi:cold shock CspA family protein
VLLAGATEKDKNDLAVDLATLFRAGRKVISDNQDLINDASKGDKGLSAEKVISVVIYE